MLISGGVDSTTLLTYLKNLGYDVHCIFFDYGQTNVEPTLAACKYYTELYKATLQVIKLPYDWSRASIIGDNFVDEQMTEENIYKKDVKEMSWVPARNAVMLLLAGGVASEMNVREVFCSFQFDKVEWATYNELELKHEFGAPDLTPAFIQTLNSTALFCYKTLVQFIAPFIKDKMDCNEIVMLEILWE